MSKRKAESSEEIEDYKLRLLLTEQKLFDLQTYTSELLKATSDGKSGMAKSTRAFYDPLLNMEIKLLREREVELSTRVEDLEKSLSKSGKSINTNEELILLRRENEELRHQVGSIGIQMQKVKEDMMEAKLKVMATRLGEATKYIEDLKAEKDKVASEVFTLKARVRDMMANGGKSVANKEDDDDSNSDADQFSSFFAAAKAKDMKTEPDSD